MPRISDVLGARIQDAISRLPAPEKTRERISWEVIPIFLPRGGVNQLGCFVVLSVPVPFTDDFEAPILPLDDINASQEAIDELVRTLYDDTGKTAEEKMAGMRVHPMAKSPGGLFIS